MSPSFFVSVCEDTKSKMSWRHGNSALVTMVKTEQIGCILYLGVRRRILFFIETVSILRQNEIRV